MKKRAKAPVKHSQVSIAERLVSRIYNQDELTYHQTVVKLALKEYCSFRSQDLKLDNAVAAGLAYGVVKYKGVDANYLRTFKLNEAVIQAIGILDQAQVEAIQANPTASFIARCVHLKDKDADTKKSSY